MLDARPMAELWPMIEATLAAGGCFRLWPRGGSMRPLLREGVDSVLLYPPKDLAPLDIVLLREESGRFLLHRIVSLCEDGVTLAGDALSTTEGPFPQGMVLAKVGCIYRGERAYRTDARAIRAFYRRAILKKRLRRLLCR